MRIFPKKSFVDIINEFDLVTQLINESAVISNEAEVLSGSICCSDTSPVLREFNFTNLGSVLDANIESLKLRSSIFEGITQLYSSKSFKIKLENETLVLYNSLNRLLEDYTLRKVLIPFKIGIYPVALVFQHVSFISFSDIPIKETDPLSECTVVLDIPVNSKVYVKRISSLNSVEEFDAILS